MCRYEDISCVMCRYEGRAELCVCVCTAQLAAHVSVSSTLQGHNLMSLAHDHIFGSESHTNVRNHETVGDLLLVYLHFWSWTQVSVYRDQDPISLFRFIKFIKTKFQRTPRLCRV